MGILSLFVIGACGDGHRHRHKDRLEDECAQLASCDVCTPVVGCGWCFDSNGVGTCAAGPDDCATPAFSWTWDQSGCPEAATAKISPSDGGARDVSDVGADGASTQP